MAIFCAIYIYLLVHISLGLLDSVQCVNITHIFYIDVDWLCYVSRIRWEILWLCCCVPVQRVCISVSITLAGLDDPKHISLLITLIDGLMVITVVSVHVLGLAFPCSII